MRLTKKQKTTLDGVVLKRDDIFYVVGCYAGNDKGSGYRPMWARYPKDNDLLGGKFWFHKENCQKVCDEMCTGIYKVELTKPN